AFFESIIGVGTFVGGLSLEEYILPLMIQSLSDSEEFVVEKVLNSLTSLAELGLFQKLRLWELIAIVASLMCHPGIWIRYGAIAFIASAAKLLPTTDVWCIIYPIIRPFLQADIAEITEIHLLENVKDPIPRVVYDAAVSWAGKSNKTLFWKPAKERKANKTASATVSGNASITNLLSRRTSTLAVNADKIVKSEEDEQHLEKIRKLGMSREDEEKIAAMRDYVYKLSISRLNTRAKTDENLKLEDGNMTLKNLGITPHNVFVIPTNAEGNAIGTNYILPKTNVVWTPSAKGSKVSLSEPSSASRVSSESNLQNLRAEDQARLISTSLREARINLSAIAPPFRERHMSLVGRSADSPKAAPATSTNITTVVGTMEIPLPAVSSARTLETNTNGKTIINNESEISRRNLSAFVSNTYEGNDRNIKNLLDNLYLEAFPEPMPVAKAVVPRPGRNAKGANTIKTISNWRPEGTLVAHLTEHKAAVNQICVSPDHNFFATCSDDGTIKIWDCSRFVKNFNCRSRITYSQQEGKIKCMTFIDSTHSIATASDNGSIHVFRIDYSAGVNSPKYGKPVIVRETYLDNEYAVVMEHYDTGNICGLDLRSMQVVWKFTNPRSHGVITAMVTDKKYRWLLIGTSRGILTLWDLRFGIQIRSWVHHTKSRIIKLLLHPQAGSSKQKWWVIVAAGKNEVSIWDIEKIECKEVYTIKNGDEKFGGISTDTFKVNNCEILRSTFTAHESSFSSDNSIRAVLYSPECNYMITGGSDRNIRFWDNNHIEDSYIIVDSDMEENKPVYR
ncbi:22017_t:CDS:10, partial [Dentiscutata erythropus]